jgi:hypothetical protein
VRHRLLLTTLYPLLEGGGARRIAPPRARVVACAGGM